jgi:hypothetical protein
VDAQKAASEGAMLGDKGAMPKGHAGSRLCKETLNVELWATGKIEATPYGVAAKMMNKTSDGGGEVCHI